MATSVHGSGVIVGSGKGRLATGQRDLTLVLENSGTSTEMQVAVRKRTCSMGCVYRPRGALVARGIGAL
jgi:hypothetical protein